MPEIITEEIRYAVLSDATKCLLHGEKDWEEMSDAAQMILYEAFYQEMPYGTATGDTGCSDEWIMDQDPQYILHGLETRLNEMIQSKQMVWDKWH